MDLSQLSTMNKAIAGGIITAVVGELARFGFQPKGNSLTVLSAIVTALVSYAIGHLVVFFAPKNKETGVTK